MNKRPIPSKQDPIKVGRLKLTVARKINRKCADIYLSSNYQKHIERRHKKELEEERILKKENSYGKNSTRFQRITAVRFLKHLGPFRRSARD